MQLHHIGVACRDIEAGIEHLTRIHQIVERSPVVNDPEQEAQLVLLTLPDGTRIELVAGRQVETLVRKNIGLYHLCFEVDDIHAEIERLVGEGARLIVPPKPAALFDGRAVAFLYVDYGMIELLSKKSD
jgi:methylmalonyl-CoA/ethylmalonyl-CoA epimerase